MSELVNLISAFPMREFLERNQKEISVKMRSSGSELSLASDAKKKSTLTSLRNSTATKPQ